MAEHGRWRRLSPAGVGALTILELVRGDAHWPDWLRDADGRPREWPRPGRLLVARLTVDGHPLDQVLVLCPEVGRCELHLHGGPAVRSAVEAALQHQGWRRGAESSEAAPGCLREAVARASSRWGTLAALRRAVAGGEPVDTGQLDRIVSLSLHAERLRRPAVVRLVGRPNAGKSTLFNRLVREQRALVSSRAGTTRDRLWSLVALHGVPVRIEDGAGLEEGERPGGPDPDLWLQVLSRPGEQRIDRGPLLVVGGKADLSTWAGVPSVSGRTGEGLDDLRGAIATALGIASDPKIDTWAETS